MADSKKLAQTLIKIYQSENADKKIEKFFEFLKEKGLLVLLPQIKKHFLRYLHALKEDETLTIVSKYPLSDSDIQNIKDMVGAPHDVVVDQKIQADALGGFSAIYKGNVYDGSLENHITQLKSRLIHS